MNPVCVKCNCEYRCKQMGVMVHRGNNSFRAGDLYECPKCGSRMVCGFAQEDLASVKAFGSKLMVANLEKANV